jgi:hypothetical protein
VLRSQEHLRSRLAPCRGVAVTVAVRCSTSATFQAFALDPLCAQDFVSRALSLSPIAVEALPIPQHLKPYQTDRKQHRLAFFHLAFSGLAAPASIVNEVSADGHAHVIKLESLGRIHATHLIDPVRVRGPWPEQWLMLPSGELASVGNSFSRTGHPRQGRVASSQTGETLVRRRLNCHITKKAKQKFYLRRQVQFTEQFKVTASQTALSVMRLHQFLCFQTK